MQYIHVVFNGETLIVYMFHHDQKSLYRVNDILLRILTHYPNKPISVVGPLACMDTSHECIMV